MKTIVALFAIAGLTGCDNRPLDQHPYSIQKITNIPELKDCTYILINKMHIMRCPGSSVNVEYEIRSGRATHHYSIVTIG